jgi:plastocyanin
MRRLASVRFLRTRVIRFRGTPTWTKYYFDPFGPQAEKLLAVKSWVGLQFNRHLLVKAEYSFEQGKEVGGNGRNHVNLFAAEAALHSSETARHHFLDCVAVIVGRVSRDDSRYGGKRKARVIRRTPRVAANTTAANTNSPSASTTTSCATSWFTSTDPSLDSRPRQTNRLRVDTKRVNQKGRGFLPHVLPIVAGTTVEWPNNDDIFHNVFSCRRRTRLTSGFTRTRTSNASPSTRRAGGRVLLHPREHELRGDRAGESYFAVADAGGKYAITNVRRELTS